MINSELAKNLQACFKLISFNENKGEEVAVNEYDIKTPSFIASESYLHLKFNVEAIFERNSVLQKILNNSSFLNNLKQYFVIDEMDIEEIENKRHKLTLTLIQASCSL